MTTPNPDFISSLVAQGSGQSSQSFATGRPGKTPDPARQGVSANVAAGTVNTGRGPNGAFGDQYHPAHPGDTVSANTPTYQSVSVDQAALALFGMTKGPGGQVAALQQLLYKSGYLTKINTPGIPDDDTAKAYGSLLQQVSASNQAGDPITVNEYLQKSADAASAAGLTGGSNRAPKVGSVFSEANPLDIVQTAQQVAQSELGRKLNSKQLAQFVAVYHGIEAHKNAQVAGSDAVTQAGGDVTVQQAPSASAAASNFVQSNFAPEYGANSVANTFDAFRKMVS